jgi:hypothetical protein
MQRPRAVKIGHIKPRAERRLIPKNRNIFRLDQAPKSIGLLQMPQDMYRPGVAKMRSITAEESA